LPVRVFTQIDLMLFLLLHDHPAWLLGYSA